MRTDDPRHGTDRGYQAHLKDRETPCDPCRDAHTYRRQLDRDTRPEPRFCPCGARMQGVLFDTCFRCRRAARNGQPPTYNEVAVTYKPRIKWVRDRHGVMRGTVLYEPEPDGQHPRVAS